MPTLFVGNLPYDTTESHLAQWFGSAGFEVESVSLQLDRFSGQLRGFAYVVVAESHTQRVIRGCNGRTFGGRTLVVGEVPTPDAAQSEELTVLSSPF